jgi:hypothetical protein
MYSDGCAPLTGDMQMTQLPCSFGCSGRWYSYLGGRNWKPCWLFLERTDSAQQGERRTRAGTKKRGPHHSCAVNTAVWSNIHLRHNEGQP